MKTKTAVVIVVLVGFIIAGTSVVYAQSSLASTTRQPNGLVGSWTVTVTLDPATGMTPFVAYNAYTRDGAEIGTTATGHPLFGRWTKIGSNQFATTFKGAEVYDGELLHYKVRKELELSPDGTEFTGPCVVDMYDVDGNLLATISGTVQATRIEVEPLD